MPGVVHLGDEGKNTYRKAERLLRKGVSVSIVGRGASMEPIIPDGTRMIYAPYIGQDISLGTPVFAKRSMRFKRRKFVSYSCHMVWMISRGHVLIGGSRGNLDFWCPMHDILGVYQGPFTESEQPSCGSKK